MAMATLALLVVVHTLLPERDDVHARSSSGSPASRSAPRDVATVAAIVFVLVSRLYKESGTGPAAAGDARGPALGGLPWARTWSGRGTASWLLSAAMMGAAGRCGPRA